MKSGIYGLAASNLKKTEEKAKAERRTQSRRPPRSSAALARGLGPLTEDDRKRLDREAGELSEERTELRKARRAQVVASGRSFR